MRIGFTVNGHAINCPECTQLIQPGYYHECELVNGVRSALTRKITTEGKS
jgi:hypothetical protein